MLRFQGKLRRAVHQDEIIAGAEEAVMCGEESRALVVCLPLRTPICWKTKSTVQSLLCFFLGISRQCTVMSPFRIRFWLVSTRPMGEGSGRNMSRPQTNHAPPVIQASSTPPFYGFHGRTAAMWAARHGNADLASSLRIWTVRLISNTVLFSLSIHSHLSQHPETAYYPPKKLLMHSAQVCKCCQNFLGNRCGTGGVTKVRLLGLHKADMNIRHSLKKCLSWVYDDQCIVLRHSAKTHLAWLHSVDSVWKLWLARIHLVFTLQSVFGVWQGDSRGWTAVLWGALKGDVGVHCSERHRQI